MRLSLRLNLSLIAAVASLIVKALFATGDIPINITPTMGN